MKSVVTSTHGCQDGNNKRQSLHSLHYVPDIIQQGLRDYGSTRKLILQASDWGYLIPDDCYIVWMSDVNQKWTMSVCVFVYVFVCECVCVWVGGWVLCVWVGGCGWVGGHVHMFWRTRVCRLLWTVPCAWGMTLYFYLTTVQWSQRWQQKHLYYHHHGIAQYKYLWNTVPSDDSRSTLFAALVCACLCVFMCVGLQVVLGVRNTKLSFQFPFVVQSHTERRCDYNPSIKGLTLLTEK